MNLYRTSTGKCPIHYWKCTWPVYCFVIKKKGNKNILTLFCLITTLNIYMHCKTLYWKRHFSNFPDSFSIKNVFFMFLFIDISITATNVLFSIWIDQYMYMISITFIKGLFRQLFFVFVTKATVLFVPLKQCV